MSSGDVPVPKWIRSSACFNGDCVEVALGEEDVLARDSKDPTGSVLVFSAEAWSGFVAGVRAGEFPADPPGC